MQGTALRVPGRAALAAAMLALTPLALGGAAAPAAAASWDMPTPYPEANFHTQNIKQFAEEIRSATDGALDITVHAAGSLIKHPEIKNAVRSGIVPIGEILMSRLSNENPVFGVDSIPFVATDYDQSQQLWKAARPVVSDLLAEEGLKLLYAVPWPPQGLYTKAPVGAMRDLRGMKFRAYNAATERIANLAGAIPTQVEVPDLPQAFATGRVDAMITSPTTGYNTKAWDYVTHYYDTKAWLPRNIVIVRQQAFDRLDAEVQEVVMEAAAAAARRGLDKSKSETAEKTRLLEKNGMQVHEASEALMSGFREIGATMAEEWTERAGQKGRRILEDYREMQ